MEQKAQRNKKKTLPIYLKTPLNEEEIKNLRSGDQVLLNGTIYTARDAAHKRLLEVIKIGDALPFELEGQVIYYVGPTPAKPGMSIGSAGPTTSYRMDPFTPPLIERGLKGMIGKGARGLMVKKSMHDKKAVYFAAIGGAGALMAKSVQSAEIVAYPESGTEAIRRLIVKDMPLIVVNDVHGGDLYEEGLDTYKCPFLE